MIAKATYKGRHYTAVSSATTNYLGFFSHDATPIYSKWRITGTNAPRFNRHKALRAAIPARALSRLEARLRKQGAADHLMPQTATAHWSTDADPFNRGILADINSAVDDLRVSVEGVTPNPDTGRLDAAIRVHGIDAVTAQMQRLVDRIRSNRLALFSSWFYPADPADPSAPEHAEALASPATFQEQRARILDDSSDFNAVHDPALHEAASRDRLGLDDEPDDDGFAWLKGLQDRVNE